MYGDRRIGGKVMPEVIAKPVEIPSNLRQGGGDRSRGLATSGLNAVRPGQNGLKVPFEEAQPVMAGGFIKTEVPVASDVRRGIGKFAEWFKLHGNSLAGRTGMNILYA